MLRQQVICLSIFALFAIGADAADGERPLGPVPSEVDVRWDADAALSLARAILFSELAQGEQAAPFVARARRSSAPLASATGVELYLSGQQRATSWRVRTVQTPSTHLRSIQNRTVRMQARHGAQMRRLQMQQQRSAARNAAQLQNIRLRNARMVQRNSQRMQRMRWRQAQTLSRHSARTRLAQADHSRLMSENMRRMRSMRLDQSQRMARNTRQMEQMRYEFLLRRQTAVNRTRTELHFMKDRSLATVRHLGHTAVHSADATAAAMTLGKYRAAAQAYSLARATYKTAHRQDPLAVAELGTFAGSNVNWRARSAYKAANHGVTMVSGASSAWKARDHLYKTMSNAAGYGSTHRRYRVFGGHQSMTLTRQPNLQTIRTHTRTSYRSVTPRYPRRL